MVNEPTAMLKNLPQKFGRILSHIEAEEPFADLLEHGHNLGLEVGVALDAPTPLSEIESFLKQVDVVLVMTINTGFSNQSFIEEALGKVERIRENYPHLPIEIDGGIDQETIKKAVNAGATRIVTTSFIFQDNNPFEKIKQLRVSAGSS
jgi:ribulose-phosphate 3-epimerase